MNYQEIALTNNEPLHNFEMFIDGQRAFIDYRLKEDKIFLIHTEVPLALQGKGLAAGMVTKALVYIEEHHLTLVPLCEYVKEFLTRHPEWNKLLG